MTQQTIDKLFQPFSQADYNVTQRFGGTGLGLSISKRLSDSLGGRLTVESEIGKGSAFTLELPTAGPPQNADLVDAWEYNTTPLVESISLRKLNAHVLVADDRRDIWRVAKYFLEKAGATVSVAEDGRQALDLVAKQESNGNAFDLILMDMQMPMVTGYDATRELRRRRFDAPIIALTAGAMKGDRQKCIDAGCTDYCAKPIDGPKLVELVRSHLAPHEVQRSIAPPARLRVLVVEDSFDVARLMARLLTGYGHEVRTASTGADALVVAREFDAEVYLIDLTLPDIDGFRLLEELKRSAPRSARFIAVSGLDSDDVKMRVNEVGFEAHFVKPINPMKLNEHIKRKFD